MRALLVAVIWWSLLTVLGDLTAQNASLPGIKVTLEGGGLTPPQNWKEKRAFINKVAVKREMDIGGVPDVHPSAGGAKTSDKYFSWHSLGYVTEARNQENCRSCWAFSTIGAFEAVYAMDNSKRAVDASEQSLVDCSTNGTCDGGWWAFDDLINPGCPTEKDYPYAARQQQCLDKTKNFKALSWGYVTDKDDIPLVHQIKSALLKYGPLSVGIVQDEKFKNHKSGIFVGNKAALDAAVNHAVIVVGWDEGKQAWQIKNSRGPDWGEKGFAWVGYGDNQIGYGAAWVLRDRKKL